MRRSRHDAYFERVVWILAEEFGWDDITRDICRRSLYRWHGRTGELPPRFEFICDSPISANWRLKPNHDAGPWGLRIAFYGRSQDGLARADELTQRLAAA